MRFKTYLMIFVMATAGPLGNILLGKGMKQAGTDIFTNPSLQAAFHVLSTPAIWLGIASLMTFFIANMLVLTWADYSYVQPAGSVAYLIVALLSIFMLGETISPMRWLGIVIICLGVFTVGRTNVNTVEGRH